MDLPCPVDILPEVPEESGGNKRTARSFLGCCFTHFWPIFSMAETRWLQGFTYNNGVLLHPPHHRNGACSCPHPLPGGAVELKETSSARPTTEEGAPHGPKPAEHSFRHLSRIEPHGASIPARWPIGCPFVLTRFAFQTSRGAHSREVPHRVPNPMKRTGCSFP